MNILAFVLTIIFFLLIVSLIVWAIGGWDAVLSFWGFRSWVRPKLAGFVKLDTPEMYGRRDYDQEMTDILKEAEKMREELPLVTLWWGLDGLQMNRDGTLEWIDIRPPKQEYYAISPDRIVAPPIPTYPLACTKVYQPILYGFDCRNATPEDRISFLKAQQQSLQLKQTQSYQTRAILDNLKQWEVVNEEKGSYVKVTDISGNSYLEPCVWTHSQEKHTL